MAARSVVVFVLLMAGAAGEQAVVLDAGSTGTRIHVITFSPRPAPELPLITRLASTKVEPGLSAFADAPRRAAESVGPLLAFAQAAVAAEARARTPILLYGTAGMRLVADAEQAAIYASVRAACDAAGFASQRGSFRTLSGEDEGFFGLIALMWLRAGSPPAPAERAAGVLDLGGGSTQIAFTLDPTAPVAGAAAAGAARGGHGVVRLGEAELVVFARSHLGFGNRAALSKVEAILLSRRPLRERVRAPSAARWVAHPCFHTGFNYTRGRETFVGSAQSGECAQLVECLFDCAGPACGGRPDGGCARGAPFARGAPPPPELRFFGLSAMFYIVNYLAHTQRLGAMPTPSIDELRAATLSACALPWAAVRAAGRDAFTPEHKLPQRCFDAHFMLALLVRGFGFGERSRQITYVEKVGLGQPEWPYGAVLHFLLERRDDGASWRRGAALALGALALASAALALGLRWARRGRYGRLVSRRLVTGVVSKTSGPNSDASDCEFEATEADELEAQAAPVEAPADVGALAATPPNETSLVFRRTSSESGLAPLASACRAV